MQLKLGVNVFCFGVIGTKNNMCNVHDVYRGGGPVVERSPLTSQAGGPGFKPGLSHHTKCLINSIPDASLSYEIRQDSISCQTSFIKRDETSLNELSIVIIILFQSIALPIYVPCIANYNNYIIHDEINVLESFKQIHINYTVIQLCFWVASMIDDENPVGADDNETADEERVISG